MKDFELSSCRYDIGCSIFIQAVDILAVGPRRDGKGAPVGEPLLGVNFLACLGIKASKEAAVVQDVEQIADNDRGRVVRTGLLLAPRYMLIGRLVFIQ